MLRLEGRRHSFPKTLIRSGKPQGGSWKQPRNWGALIFIEAGNSKLQFAFYPAMYCLLILLVPPVGKNSSPRPTTSPFQHYKKLWETIKTWRQVFGFRAGAYIFAKGLAEGFWIHVFLFHRFPCRR